MELFEFLETSYTAYQAVENAESMLQEGGFSPLSEYEHWALQAGGKYYVKRDGAIIAFRYRGLPLRIVASHTDSPCLKLKENAALSDEKFTRLNVEPYGGGLWYTFFDRPLRIAGRIVREENGKLVSASYVSPYRVTLPSLAIHQNRDANEKFSPNLQKDLPLLALGKSSAEQLFGGACAYDLFLVPDEKPYVWGMNGEFYSSPRIDNLSSVYLSVRALIDAKDGEGTPLVACFSAEEIGSRTYDGAASDFLRTTVMRIAGEEFATAAARSFLVSLDNAHSVHPNHAETCDPTNQPVLGAGPVIKGHAGGAYTTGALTSAVMKKIFALADVPFQTFFNRSDARSGSTLGALSLGEIGIPSVDIGLAQLAMHSAVETAAIKDVAYLCKGLTAFFEHSVLLGPASAEIR